MNIHKYTANKNISQVTKSIGALIDKNHKIGKQIECGKCIGNVSNNGCDLIGSSQVYHGFLSTLPPMHSDADVEVKIKMKFLEKDNCTEIESIISTDNMFGNIQISLIAAASALLIYFIANNILASIITSILIIALNQLSKKTNIKREIFWQEYIRNYINIETN